MMTREQTVAEAIRWIGTPYHKNGRVCGVGADCATLIFCVYVACGLIPAGQEGVFNDPRLIGQDWFCHASEGLYVRLIEKYALRVAEAISFPQALDVKGFSPVEILPGNIVACKTKEVGSRHFNHGGIVVRWPQIIHAVSSGVEQCDASTNWMWNHNRVMVFDPWAKIEQSYIPETETAT